MLTTLHTYVPFHYKHGFVNFSFIRRDCLVKLVMARNLPFSRAEPAWGWDEFLQMSNDHQNTTPRHDATAQAIHWITNILEMKYHNCHNAWSMQARIWTRQPTKPSSVSIPENTLPTPRGHKSTRRMDSSRSTGWKKMFVMYTTYVRTYTCVPLSERRTSVSITRWNVFRAGHHLRADRRVGIALPSHHYNAHGVWHTTDTARRVGPIQMRVETAAKPKGPENSIHMPYKCRTKPSVCTNVSCTVLIGCHMFDKCWPFAYHGQCSNH